MADAGAKNVVLVHGGFVDGSGWEGVYRILKRAGYSVTIVQNPTLSLADDVAVTRRALAAQNGPAVLVGHSYGGVVITEAGTDPKVAALVYVAAFAPDEGESLQEIEGGSQDSILPSALRQTDYPVGSGSEMMGELSIDLDLFREAFAADLPAEQAAVMARSQRPVSVAAFGEKTGTPAWKKLPSWAVVATRDKAAGSDVVLSMARRAGAEVIAVDASHVPMMSQPGVVAGVILTAAKAVA